TLEAMKRRLIPSQDVRDLLDASMRVVFGAEPREISYLHFLFYANAAGGLLPLIDVEGGAQQDRFVDGAQSLPDRLAKDLGDALHLGSPVEAIEQTGALVTLRGPSGTVKARHVIIAVPPNLAARIRFEPQLPAPLDMLWQRTPMGSTIKCHLLYDRKFWKEAGLSGEAVSNSDVVSVVFDNSTHQGQPALLAFVVGDAARRWGAQDPEQRRQAVVDTLVRMFGPQAARYTHYQDLDWSQELWTRGCPNCAFPPGAWTTLGQASRRPVGRIHWAGTETATQWYGFMEGALEAAERAATEVLRA
ncbi:MAG: FAD-dependent oxidoreductase, partial [Myxococcales bacterium]|nr:FAD-dependent oxidoreductase [Myxococcales bacterium]